MNTNFFGKFGKKIAVVILGLFSVAMFTGIANAAITSVTLTTPNGGEAWNTTQNITWSCSDNGISPKCSDTTINDIVYSPDGGTTWEGIGYVGGSVVAGTGTYSWDTTAIPNTESSSGIIKVVSNSPSINDISDTSFTVDNTPPTIDTITTDDSDGDGFIDSMTLTFIEANPMDDNRISTAGFTVAGHTSLGANGTWSGQDFTFTINETTDQTDATPDVAYTNPSDPNGLQDGAGNDLINFGATTPTDGAKPVMMSAITSDLDNNGQIDIINVTFSEDLDGNTVNGSGSDFVFLPAYTTASASEPSSGIVTIILNENSTPDTGVTPLVSIVSGQTIKDLPGNALANGDLGSTITPADGAAPVAISSEYFTNLISSTPEDINRFRVYFSELISPIAYGDFASIADDITVTANGLIGFADPTGIGDYNNGTNNVYFARATGTGNLTGINGSGGEPTWSYLYDNTNTLKDASGNLWTAIAPGAETMVDKANPVVIDDVALDTNGDGNVDTLELQFSEFVEDGDFTTGGSLSDWTLSSDSFSSSDAFDTFSTVVTDLATDTDANNDFVSLSLTPSNVLGTGVVEYNYTNGSSPTDDITDSDTNRLADISGIAATDGAKPVVTVGQLITNDNTPELTGTISEAPTASIDVTVVGVGTYSATNNGNGTWTLPDNTITTLTDEDYDVTVTATDSAGNVGSDTVFNWLTIDTVLPTITGFSKPIVDTVYRVVNTILSFTPNGTGTAASCSYSLDGGTTNNNVPCWSGTAVVDDPVIGLVEGRNSIELTVTDAAGNSVTDAPRSFVYDTDGILTVAATGADFPTIQGAIDAWVTGIDTIQVAVGNYPENINIDQVLKIIGPNTGIDPNTTTRVSEATISGATTGSVVTIAKSGVTIDGLTITNGGVDGTGIYSADFGNLTVQNNIITDIGNGSDDIVGRGIIIVSSSSVVDNVTIQNNRTTE